MKSVRVILAVILVIPALSLEAQSSSAASWYERGRLRMVEENWYAAAEAFLETLRLSPAHAEGTAALAECYYELGEFDESYSWIKKARALARADMALANLEAFCLIAQGQLDAASRVIEGVLEKEPYNKEALFAQAELDIARGHPGDAVIRYREAVRRFPDDRRLLISLALVLGSLGDDEGGRHYIERALIQHPGDYRVHYYAAYLDSKAGRLREALAAAEKALSFRNDYDPARLLLASLRYRAGHYEEAARLADELISHKRENGIAWYLKGISLVRMGRPTEAVSVLSNALSVAPEDEFIRATLEEILISHTSLEDPLRAQWASWHFGRARDFRSRNLVDQSAFEYRRGLRLNPYARDRREYADVLKIQKYPARYLEELKVLRELGLEDRDLDDAVETYDALLDTALFRRWGVDPVSVTQPHWKVAVFSVGSQPAFIHSDAEAAAALYIRELMVHERNIVPMDIELRRPSFSEAFRAARTTEADYYLIITVSESERDLAIKGELYVARTGAPAASFYSYRTGGDRLRAAARSVLNQLGSALPFKAELIRRRQAQGLIDKGRADGVKNGAVYQVVRQGRSGILNEGIGVMYAQDDVVGTLSIESADEEVSAGVLTRNGFFDRISPGDDIYLVPEKTPSPPALIVTDPELRALLRTLR